jgi:hypothetical protein
LSLFLGCIYMSFRRLSCVHSWLNVSESRVVVLEHAVDRLLASEAPDVWFEGHL